MKKPEIYNGARLENDLTITGDVAIVGTGAGGGVCAEMLTKLGLRVIMIEEGSYNTANDFNLHELPTCAELYFDCASRKTKDFGINILQGRTVGGSTTVNWTSCFRIPLPTMNHWREVYGLDVFNDEEMLPFFETVEKRLHVSRWKQPANLNNEALARGATKLGWRHGIMHRNVRQCLDLGYCGLGCPTNAKQSMLITTIPFALEHGGALITNTRADRLNIRADQVTGIDCIALNNHGTAPTGKRIHVETPFVIISAGGINSPALLLRSKAPDPHKNLGKRTFLHVTTGSTAIMPEIIDGFKGAPQSIYSDEFLWHNGITGRVGYKLEVPPLQPILAMSFTKNFGQQLASHADQFRQFHILVALLRDGFNDASQGGNVLLKSDGDAVLDYPMNDYLWDGIRRAYLSMAECQFAAGAKTVLPAHLNAQSYSSWSQAKTAINKLHLKTPNVSLFSGHVMGGCAMGQTPQHSVVNSDGRHHHLENLAIIDGSTFPTSLGVNPQLTIYALAARQSMKLAKDFFSIPHAANLRAATAN